MTLSTSSALATIQTAKRGSAKAELAVMNAKAQLRQAMAEVQEPVTPKAKVAKPKAMPKPKSTKASKPTNGKAPVPAVATAS